LVSKNKEVIATALKFAQARLSPPTFAQIASEAALETPQSYFDDVIKEYKDRRNTLIENLQQIPGVKVGVPKGAFYCIVELPVENSDHFAQWLLEEFDYEGSIKQKKRLRVATKYPQAAREFFSNKGVHIDVIKLYGSMELAPIVGMSDVIVDLVSSGKTLEANNLKAFEKISDISSRLIINQAALKIKREQLKPLIENFSKVAL
jgi:ATP phosphoribosyltransferase